MNKLKIFCHMLTAMMAIFVPHLAVAQAGDQADADVIAPRYPPHAEFIVRYQWAEGYCGEIVVRDLSSRDAWQVTARLKGDIVRISGATYRGIFNQPYNLVFTPDYSSPQYPYVISLCATGDHILDVFSVDLGYGVKHRPLAFQPLAQGFNALNVRGPINLIANHQEELKQIEELIGQRLYVQLDRYTVIGTFMGRFSTGGYSIETASAVEVPGRPDTLDVELIWRSPASDCAVTLAETSPYQVIAIPKTDRPVNFIRRQRVAQCDN